MSTLNLIKTLWDANTLFKLLGDQSRDQVTLKSAASAASLMIKMHESIRMTSQHRRQAGGRYLAFLGIGEVALAANLIRWPIFTIHCIIERLNFQAVTESAASAASPEAFNWNP